MSRENVNDLYLFLAVAEERSFTKAAARLGMSQSALSHAVRALEARLGVRLLSRTTRSVSPTDAGERLVKNVAPRLAEIDAELTAVSDLGDKPAGMIRITAIDHVIDQVLWPRLAGVLEQYPDVHVEISSDYRLIDVAAERFDIGVRYGDQVEKDMVAVRLTPDVPMTIVGSPRYFETHRIPADPNDLVRHNCITLRLSSGGLYAWELRRDGQKHRCPRHGAGDVHRRVPDVERGLERLRLGVPAGGADSAACRCWTPRPGHGRRVSELSRAVRLLPQPSQRVARAAVGDRHDPPQDAVSLISFTEDGNAASPDAA